MNAKNQKHTTRKETRYASKDMIERRRKECNPIYMPSGVIMEKDTEDFMQRLFPGGKFDYIRGDGYVIRIGDAVLLVGGHYNDFKYVRRWLVEQVSYRIECELKSPVLLLAA